MSEILGYTQGGKPIHPIKPGMIATACVISCSVCREMIRGMGGPMRGAVCRTCYQLDREVPDASSDPSNPERS